jgi:Fe-S cluster assembly iron-binding protein IscA
MGNIGISAKAVTQLREQIVNSCVEAGIGFRMDVSTDESGEASFSIKIDRQRQGDEVIESDGIKIFLDRASARQIRGYQLDYQDEPRGGFFLNTMQETKSG